LGFSHSELDALTCDLGVGSIGIVHSATALE